jgi:holo-[acyl-carrier protein] synthase
MIEKHGELFLTRVFTERELQYCSLRRNSTEHFSAWWAGKEAVFKSLGIVTRGASTWTDIEISLDPATAQPRVILSAATLELAEQKRVGSVLLSVAYCRSYATAHCLAIGKS